MCSSDLPARRIQIYNQKLKLWCIRPILTQALNLALTQHHVDEDHNCLRFPNCPGIADDDKCRCHCGERRKAARAEVWRDRGQPKSQDETEHSDDECSNACGINWLVSKNHRQKANEQRVRKVDQYQEVDRQVVYGAKVSK